MQYHEAEFLVSGAGRSQWPDTQYPEVIFAGRSNAGKSTLINNLVNRKQLAYSGKTPGKTRLLNFFLIDNQMIFTDAPGYGYAKGDNESAKTFARIIDPYFREREQLKAMVLVMDCRRVPNQDDIAMIEYAKHAHLAILVVLTKIDKLTRSAMLQNCTKIANTLQVNKSVLLPYNGLNKQGIDEIWERIHQYVD
ncbi:MAG: ribosome biogenesis GTP-binding protein YihA/YsxC [Bulleidia sp.]|nr:ribosome biogenesis GTP-binding protein YihA/YsxC [Bulleidia sp.]